MFHTLRWPAKRLQSIVIAGCILGIVTPIGAMAISSTPSEAAVAVIDQRNIQEAIKTANQTAKILTTEQKELALQILDAKKLSPKMHTPIKTAVTGSRAPMMAEGVLPIFLMAMVMKNKLNTVGSKAS